VILEAAVAKRKQDPKVEALRSDRALNPRPEAVTDEEFGSSEFFDARDLVQVKYEMVRRVRVGGESVSGSAAAFGFSRPSFYQAAAAVDAHGLAGLVPARPGPRGAHKLTEEVLAFARAAREDDPALRSADLADRIAQRFGVSVHPRSVERALARVREPKSGDGR
jgi:transposase